MNLRNCTLLMALLLDIILATKASASPWDYQKYIINGNIEKIAEGVRKYPSSLNPESETSFLKMACDADNLASVRYLVDHGAKLNSNGPHMSVLALAAARGHLDIVKFLVSRGAQVNAVSHQITPLMSAATFSNVDVVKFLLSKGANANAVIRIKEKYGFHFQIGFTALHFLTVSKPAFFRNRELGFADQITIAKALITAGCNPNIKSSPKNGPLIGSKAAWQFATYSIELMQAAGAPDNILSEQSMLFPNEIALQGNIVSGNLKTQSLRASINSFYIYDGNTKKQKRGAIKPAKEKEIILSPETVFYWVGRKGQLSVRDARNVKRTPQTIRDGKIVPFDGKDMRFIGIDGGTGKPLAARCVIILSYPEYADEVSSQEKWTRSEANRHSRLR